jgi:hypothetical protein
MQLPPEHCPWSEVVVRGGVEPPTFRFQAEQTRWTIHSCPAWKVPGGCSRLPVIVGVVSRLSSIPHRILLMAGTSQAAGWAFAQRPEAGDGLGSLQILMT